MICVSDLALYAQSVERLPNESLPAFAKRFAPEGFGLATNEVQESSKYGDALCLELHSWNSDSNLIAVFYKKELRNDDNDDYLLGYLFVPMTGVTYRQILIDTIGPEGGRADVLAVFPCNADHDKEQELAVLTVYPVQHYDVYGQLYSTYFYDSQKSPSVRELTLIENLSNKFVECDCSWRDGSTKQAKYKTARAVKRRLTRMGFTQSPKK
jgi:hypothetical protein